METTKPNSKKANVIRGIPVEFPYEPYGSQLGFMNRVISTLDRAHTEGHCHALLESPTGTGKSLSLLCSSLAWQKNFKAKNLYANLSHSKPAPEAVSDPLGYGGGFIPETQTQRTSAYGDPETGTPAANGKNLKKKICPTIFYATRTHSQISQVIREYRKTAYRVPMAVLASRKHYCTNTNVQGRKNLDEECKMLLKDRNMGCSEYKNMHKVKGHPAIQKGGCYEAHDIEDLVKIGQTVKGCPYYAARSMADNAQLVFCPYSYIINPVIRGAMEVDIKGAIVIFDEAHNIEDIARDAGSVDLEEDVLDKLQVELLRLCGSDRDVYQPLFEMIRDITDWMRRKKKSLEKREFQHYFSCWTGHNALRELREAADISPLRFSVLLECAKKAIKAATDMESDECHLNGMCVLTLEGLFSSLSYFFSGNSLHIHDYQLALQRYMKREAGNATGNWTYTMSLWCLNPAVVFKEIADLSLSVILTSGTLSPVNSFSSELGVQFGTCLEAQHVVDVDSRLWAAVISRGPDNHQLNASYKTSDGYAFQDALGKSIEEICKIVPGGALIFFPSYKFMEKMCTRWCETGQWARLHAQKPLFVEPRGGTQDDFEPILKGYYDSIQCGSKPTFGRKKKGKKLDWNNPYRDSNESSNKGAAFLAVCRGKVSEGIDFSDENARVVIVVGIPFPNINDIQVAQKKKYNDAYKSSKNLISGNEWYCYQAFRALNQAAGRCLRHRYDYGAIILLDERFQEERNTAYISKWLKKSIRQYDDFEKSLEGLKSFFNNAKEQFDRKPMNILPEPDNHVKEYFYKNQKKEDPRTKNQKLNNFEPSGLDSPNKIPARKSALVSQSFTYSSKYEGTSPVSLQQQSHGNGKSQPIKDVKDIYSCRVYIDLDGSPQRASRCSKAASVVSSDGSPDTSIVRESADINDFMSPGSLCKDENSSTTFGGASPQIQNQLNQPRGVSPTATCSLVVTPNKVVDGGSCHFKPDTEASLNSSVNSYAQKRRKFIRSSLLDQVHDSDAVGIEVPGHVYSTGSTMTKDASHSSEFGAGALQKCEKENGCQPVLQNDDSVSSGPAPEVLGSFPYKLQQNSSGWRSTRSKLRLPRRAVLTDLDA